MKNWNNYKNEINDYISGRIQTKEFADNVGVQPRVARAFKQRYKSREQTIYIHGNTGKCKPRKAYIILKKQVLDIFFNTRNRNGRNPFEHTTYRNFLDFLADEKHIFVKETWLKKILKQAGYISPETCRAAREKHKGRFRKDQFGELVQGDGTSFDWFGDGRKRCIQGFIDDATGIPVGLYMTENECLLGYNEAFMQMAEKYGIPASLYLDGASVFFVNQKPVSKDEYQEKKLTQFGSAMEKLGVEMIRAKSPQAKGKVERFWRTLKYRLVSDFLYHNIDNVKDANIYLREKFIPKMTAKFGRKPKVDIPMFVRAETDVLRKIMRVRYHSITDAAGVFTILGYKFVCPELKNRHINIYASERDGIYVSPANKDIRHDITLAEGDSSGAMPQVMKNLIDEFFLKDTKSPFREVYYDVDADIA